ncbi:hypothetical protein C0995_001464 [Termitomyces sp. Mi166|nr:hypothetical protein C0995_001464 [Termitomyces sp. Mi166\
MLQMQTRQSSGSNLALVTAYEGFLRALTQVEDLDFYPAHPETLSTLFIHIVTLPSLRSFRTGVFLPPALSPPKGSALMMSTPFLNLPSLSFQARAWEEARMVMQSIASPLMKLYIEVTGRALDGQQNNPFPFLNALAEHPCVSTLIDLCLIDDEEDGEFPDSRSLYRLLRLTSLESLYLSIHGTPRMTDDWLAQAAATWPRLRNLEIPCFTWTTLYGLVPLVKECHELECLSVSGIWKPLDINRLRGITGNTRITTLCVEELDVVGNVTAVFRCLITLFPMLRGITCENCGYDEEELNFGKLKRCVDESLELDSEMEY